MSILNRKEYDVTRLIRISKKCYIATYVEIYGDSVILHMKNPLLICPHLNYEAFDMGILVQSIQAEPGLLECFAHISPYCNTYQRLYFTVHEMTINDTL